MSKKTLPCPTEIWNAERERWMAYRRANRPTVEPDEPAEVFRVREIAQSLHDMRWADRTDYPEPTPLQLAVCDDRWDLIHKATTLLEREVLPRQDPRRLAHDGKWIAFCLSQITEPKLGKADILEYLEKVHPEIFKAIPATLKARTSWWAEVGGEQVRSSVSPLWKKQFKALIEHGLKMKNAGFPAYLGPRENPSWE